MAIHKSRVEQMLGLHLATLEDLYFALAHLSPHEQCNTAEELTLFARRDSKTLRNRTISESNDETLGFLTVELPKLGKFLDGLLSGKELPEHRFKTDDSGFPLFLRPVWTLIQRGQVSAPIAHVIRCARTLLYLSYKLEVPFSKEQEQQAIDSFREIENELKADPYVPDDLGIVWRASHVCSLVLEGFSLGYLRPKHGPGAVATGERGDGKWEFTHLYDTLHQEFPYYDFMWGVRSSGRAIHLAAEAEKYRKMVRHPYPTAKLILVPKDSRGPRVISSEPLELQFMQQAVAIPLVRYIERWSVAAGFVNFTDQSINANLALSGSILGELATIDLSEASDRVSLSLFKALWPTRLQKPFLALRSHATQLPSGEEILLEKFAPMGSALCFPVESVIFYSLCVAALIERCGYSEELAMKSVYVYGDDIIVPSSCYEAVSQTLTMVNLKVNHGKSFWEGNFRESCGVDAWHGHVVTPLRVRKFPGRRPSDASAHIAWAAYASQFGSNELFFSMAYCVETLKGVIGWIPVTSSPQGYLSVVLPKEFGLTSTLDDYRVFGGSELRWNANLCYPEFKGWVTRQRMDNSTVGGYSRLLRNLLGQATDTPSLVVAPKATQMSKRWAPLREFDVFDWLGSR